MPFNETFRPHPPTGAKELKETVDARNALDPSINQAWDIFHGHPTRSEPLRKAIDTHLPVRPPDGQTAVKVNQDSLVQIEKIANQHPLDNFEQLSAINLTAASLRRLQQQVGVGGNRDVDPTNQSVTMMRESLWRLLPNVVSRSLRTMDRYATLRQRFPGVPRDEGLERNALTHVRRLRDAMSWRVTIGRVYDALDAGGVAGAPFQAVRKALVAQQPGFAQMSQALVKERAAQAVANVEADNGPDAKKETAQIRESSQAFLKTFDTRTQSLLKELNAQNPNLERVEDALDAAAEDSIEILVGVMNVHPEPIGVLYSDFLVRILDDNAAQHYKITYQRPAPANRDRDLKTLESQRKEMVNELNIILPELGESHIHEFEDVLTPEGRRKYEGQTKIDGQPQRSEKQLEQGRKAINDHVNLLTRGFRQHLTTVLEGNDKQAGLLAQTPQLQAQDLWYRGEGKADVDRRNSGRIRFWQMLNTLVEIRALMRLSNIPRLIAGNAGKANEEFRVKAMGPLMRAMGLPENFNPNNAADWDDLPDNVRKVFLEKCNSIITNINTHGPEIRRTGNKFRDDLIVLEGVRAIAPFDALRAPLQPDAVWAGKVEITQADLKELQAAPRPLNEATKSKLLAAYLVLYGQLRGSWRAYSGTMTQLSEANLKVLNVGLDNVEAAHKARDILIEAGMQDGSDVLMLIVFGVVAAYAGRRLLPQVPGAIVGTVRMGYGTTAWTFGRVGRLFRAPEVRAFANPDGEIITNPHAPRYRTVASMRRLRPRGTPSDPLLPRTRPPINIIPAGGDQGAAVLKGCQDWVRRVQVPGANINQLALEAQELFGITAREARLIAMSPRAQRIFAGASTAEEVSQAVRLARQAAAFRVVLHSVSAGLDVFGIVMAFIAFRENGNNLKLAQETGNRELQEFYRNAQIMNVVEGGVATVGLVCSGIAIYASVTGSTMFVCGAASFVSGTVMLPLGVGLALSGPYRASLDHAAETFMRNPADWHQRSTDEILGELERLSRANYTWGEMATVTTNIELFWNYSTSGNESYQKWWQSRLGLLEGGVRGTRANLCAAYILQTTFLPRRSAESEAAYNDRVRDHVAVQMAYLNARSRGGYDLYDAQHFREAKYYADLIMAGRAPAPGGAGRVEFEYNEKRHNVDLAGFAKLPFHTSNDGAISQAMVLQAFMQQQRGLQLLALSQSRTAPIRSMEAAHFRLINVQRELHGMLLVDIRPDLDRFSSAVEAYDFDGIGPAETNARKLVRYGVSLRLEAAIQRAETRLLGQGTLNIEEYEKGLREVRAVISARGDQLQKLHDELATDASLVKRARAQGDDYRRFTDIRHFQSPPRPQYHTAQFIESMVIPPLAAMQPLPQVVSNSYEETQAKDLQNTHARLMSQREALESRKKSLLTAAQNNTLGSEHTTSNTYAYFQDRPNPPVLYNYDWQRQERAECAVLNFDQWRDIHANEVEEFERELSRYLSSITGPNRAGYRLTRDIEAASRTRLRRDQFQPYLPGEALFASNVALPRVFGHNVDATDAPVLDEVLRSITPGTGAWYFLENPLDPEHIRSITFTKHTEPDGKIHYLVTFIVNLNNMHQHVTRCIQIGVVKDGSQYTMGQFVNRQIDAKSLADLPHPAPNETEEIRKIFADGVTPTQTVDQEGGLFRRLLSVDIDTLSVADRIRFESARKRYRAQIGVLIGCQESDVALLLAHIPSRFFPAYDLLGLQIQGRSRSGTGRPDQFLVTYVATNGLVKQVGMIIENGRCRRGPWRTVTGESPTIRILVQARLQQRDTVNAVWRSYERRVVGRNQQGPIYAVRVANSLVLHQYIDDQQPRPARLVYRVLNISPFAQSSAEHLEDAVATEINTNVAQWQPVAAKTASSYRQAALKGYRENVIPGRHDVRLDDASILLGHLVSLPRPGQAPNSTETVDRAISALGLDSSVNDDIRRRLSEMHQAIGQQHFDSENRAHLVLQLSLERLAVRHQQFESGQPNPINAMSQIEDIVRDQCPGLRLDPPSPGSDFNTLPPGSTLGQGGMPMQPQPLP